MKKNFKSFAIAGGVLMSLGAALIPLTTYAEVANPTVTVTVSPVLTLDSTTNASVTADSSRVETTTFNAKVIANKGYTISLHATKPQLTLNNATATGDNSTQIPATSTLTAGTNGWGIMKKKADNSAENDTDYTAITSISEQFYKATSGTVAAGVTTTFTVGVAIASTLTAGNYSTNLTLTAATI